MKPLLVIALLIFTAEEPQYDKIFGSDYADAVSFVKENKNLIKQSCTKFSNDPEMVVSMVFPELVRYSMLRDFFETAALETVYVQGGATYANFSVGRFQMKPSFVEDLEKQVQNSFELSKTYINICAYTSNNEQAIRLERVARLKNIEWQLIYANCFVSICDKEYATITFANKKEKLRFYATAYNCGLGKTQAEIQQWINRKVFPYGMKEKSANVAYADVAVFFFEKHLQKTLN